MDNLCHTLAGLALGEAGLKRRAPLGRLTLMLAANLPDVDAAAAFWGRTAALGFRRGWTHGILAMGVWPFLLAALMYGADRLRRAPGPGTPGERFRGLLLLATLGVWSHPLLDLTNVYGVRLLMPFSERWFYGDALFIVDPWIWLALIAGIVLVRRRERLGAPRAGRPARVALATVALYIAVMAMLSAAGRGITRREMGREGFAVTRVMAAPVPLDPLRRDVVFVTAAGYGTADLAFLTARDPDGSRAWRPVSFFWGGGEERPPRLDEPAVRRATRGGDGAAFLRWARFPYARTGAADGCRADRLCLADLRYDGQGWASLELRW